MIPDYSKLEERLKLDLKWDTINLSCLEEVLAVIKNIPGDKSLDGHLKNKIKKERPEIDLTIGVDYGTFKHIHIFPVDGFNHEHSWYCSLVDYEGWNVAALVKEIELRIPQIKKRMETTEIDLKRILNIAVGAESLNTQLAFLFEIYAYQHGHPSDVNPNENEVDYRIREWIQEVYGVKLEMWWKFK